MIIGCAKTGHQHPVNSGYRPGSEYADQFVRTLGTSTLAVYPTIVRTITGTTYSDASQKQIVELLNNNTGTSAIIKNEKFYPGPLKGPPQWDIFVHDMNSIADDLKKDKVSADFVVVMEVILPPDTQSVWGIHCFIFDQQGNNVFSFLLNSHHKLFSDANLIVDESSGIAVRELIEKATQVGFDALIQQMQSTSGPDRDNNQGYTITSQKITAPEKSIDRIFIFSRIHERLVNVVMHSLKHSMESGFKSNNVEPVVKVIPRDSTDYAKFQNDVENLGPDITMYIDLDPLLRARSDGYEAIVGTVFKVRAFNQTSDDLIWEADGKVDYIKIFEPGYIAHPGILKELAWHTTAAIVRTFMLDMKGHKSAPIYTVTEDRAANGQRID